MITAVKIYENTHEGIDIILDLVPQASVAVDNPKKTAIKYRPDERTASAYLIAPDGNHPYWRLIDYGISDKPKSPVDIYLREKGMTQNQFTQALHELAEKYGIEDEKITQSNRPEWNDRPAAEGEVEGQRVFETRDTFTESEIKLWGPHVTEDHLRTYGWKPLMYVGTVKSGRVKECRSTDTYPMFIQECHYNDEEGRVHTFHKVYKPREYNKRYRFEYIGQVPKDYMYGLEALQCAFRKNEEKKLTSVFLVSGGSDAVNCLSMGGQAVWLNSESADLTEKQHKMLYEYAHRIYAIGDIDATGKECARRLALRYLDICSITLPEELMNRFHDSRGHLRKDLKDYISLRPGREDFWHLVKQARQAKFWMEITNKEGVITGYSLSPTALAYFLELHGYYTLVDKRHDRPRYIHVEGMFVDEVCPKNIKNFLNSWCQEQALPEALQNVVRRSKDLPNKETSNLRELDLNFTSATSTSQLCFFRNCWVEVTAKGIAKHSYKEVPQHDTYVWRHNLIPHDYIEHKPMFSVVRRDDGTYGAVLTEDAKSDVLTCFHHSSRLYWRQKDEEGIPLTPEQQKEEEQCLAAKIDSIGYYLHRYRCSSFSVAAILQDAFMAEDEKECNGRSGKSFFFKFLMVLVHYFFIDARNPDIVDDRFLFDGVTEATDLIIVDECARTLQFSCFFGKITGPFRNQEKHGHPFEISSDKAPKMIFGSNYVIKKLDSSTEARLWPQVFSDYYHAKAQNNDYRESRSIRDDFGYNLLDDDYPEEKWQADIAFAMQCLQFYLSLPVAERKIMPPMGNIQRRTQRAIIGKNFEEWAADYYQEGSEHLDVTENYDDVLADYCRETGDRNMSPKTFTRKLKDYCSFAEHIHCYNPAELTETKKEGDRIRQRMEGNAAKKITKIHIRSVRIAEELSKSAEEATITQTATQLDLFDSPSESEPIAPFKAALDLDTDEDAPF